LGTAERKGWFCLSRKIFTVSEINHMIQEALKRHAGLRDCWVSGEISNFKNHIPSGHWYFTLKDESSGLKTVMFKTRTLLSGFEPTNGMKVLVRGSIKIYERDGSVQLYAEEMFPSGLGALYLAFEQLKTKLSEEGLFAAERKRPIPKYPRRIAVVTSPTGAAFKDIKNIALRRNPLVELVLFPSAVQGDCAPGEIAEAIARANGCGQFDLLIVGRGGGSLEELWAFNTEEVARAIAASGIPVISAVGHEIDYTIADFTADLRAPTPSAAAEIAIPLLTDLQAAISSYEQKLKQGILRILEKKRQQVRDLGVGRALSFQSWRIEQSRQDLDMLALRLQEGMTGFIAHRDGILKLLAAKLDLLSPLTTLERGYSLISKMDGRIVRSVGQLKEGEQVRLRLKDGRADCEVLKIEPNK